MGAPPEALINPFIETTHDHEPLVPSTPESARQSRRKDASRSPGVGQLGSNRVSDGIATAAKVAERSKSSSVGELLREQFDEAVPLTEYQANLVNPKQPSGVFTWLPAQKHGDVCILARRVD